jgi:hypothetical protein
MCSLLERNDRSQTQYLSLDDKRAAPGNFHGLLHTALALFQTI